MRRWMDLDAMLPSDDFDIEDDDTIFLAAATQFEVSQTAGVEPSSRPTKRRRISLDDARLSGEHAHREGSPVTDGEDDGFESQVEHFAGVNPSIRAGQSNEIDNEDDETNEYYFPGELGPIDENAKQSRYKIHVPAAGGKLQDFIFTQTQHGLDEDPTALRGAVWKRPAPIVLAEKINEARKPAVSASAGMRAPLAKSLSANGITNYFQAAHRENIAEGDAALAARLQREEDEMARKRNPLNSALMDRNPSPSGDAPQDVADFPSDAFVFSSPEFSQMQGLAENRRSEQPRLRAPQNGLKQMTMFGQPATQALSTSQAASKRHAWPLKSRDEPPTHHKLDERAMATWTYPTNLGATRDYQYNIVSRSLFHNTLVALPTGLGKTFIAATIMLNYYRWTAEAQVVFVAPTKPLIAQQMDACYNIAGIPRRDTILMTGETSPSVRADEWRTRRVFFMTPQTVINDLKTGICDPKKIVLLVVDEAHKATGSYAYTEVVAFLRRFNPSFRVLALTATPGSTVEGVQNVIDSLGIARVELRTEQSIDIRPYTFDKQTEVELFDYDGEQSLIMGLISQALQPAVDKLCQQNAYWSRDPMNLTAYGLTDQRRRWMSSEAGRKAPQPVKGMINAIFTILSKIAHNIGLLKNHGIRPFHTGMLGFQKSVQSGEHKGKTASGIVNSDPFVKMMSTLRMWTNDHDFIGHPKLEYLRQVVLGHFLDAGEGRQGRDVPPSATRVMVFASYRDSTEEICRVLKRNEPMVRPHVFVGQASSKESEGMNQKRQNEVIQDFKSGKYNVLIATSIGEEGLDIGTVDLIVNYDTSSSPIRMLQRNGRTARKRTGRVVLLLMRGKEERDYEKAQDTYVGIQKTIADETRYEYRDDQSPRILPKHIQPIVDKRAVEIPVENSQPIDLNERGRRKGGKGKTKRPAKKFHMPDGVRTGFVRASRLGSDDDDASDDQDAGPRRPLQKRTLKKTTKVPKYEEPDIAQLPYLGDVLLTDAQRKDHQRRYTRTFDDTDDAVISAPDGSQFPEMMRNLGPTKFVRHGRRAYLAEKAMRSVRGLTEAGVERMKDVVNLDVLEDNELSRRRLTSLESELGDSRHNHSTRVSTASNKSKARTSIVRQQRNESCNLASDQSSASDSDLPDLAVARSHQPVKPRGRAPNKPHQNTSDATAALAQAQANIRPRPAAPKSRQARTRPVKRPAGRRAFSGHSSAAEGSSSSPEATPANMRLPSQGIDLGSDDTSGDDVDEDDPDPDSELAAFIAPSSESIEMASSSSLLSTSPMGRKLQRKRMVEAEPLSDVDEEDEEGEEVGDVSGSEQNSELHSSSEVERVAPTRRGRRVVEESDDEG